MPEGLICLIKLRRAHDTCRRIKMTSKENLDILAKAFVLPKSAFLTARTELLNAMLAFRTVCITENAPVKVDNDIFNEIMSIIRDYTFKTNKGCNIFDKRIIAYAEYVAEINCK